MERHLFLTGPGAGAALREALGQKLLNAGGFVTEAERAEDGSLLGASLLPAAAAGGAEGFAPLPFLDLRSSPPLHDNEVFRGEGARLLEEAVWYPFAVLEAPGSFELLIPQYRAALSELLNAELPLLGVLSEEREAVALCRRLGLGPRVEQNIAQLRKALRADPNTRVAELSGLSRRRALRSLEQWIKEYA